MMIGQKLYWTAEVVISEWKAPAVQYFVRRPTCQPTTATFQTFPRRFERFCRCRSLACRRTTGNNHWNRNYKVLDLSSWALPPRCKLEKFDPLRALLKKFLSKVCPIKRIFCWCWRRGWTLWETKALRRGSLKIRYFGSGRQVSGWRSLKAVLVSRDKNAFMNDTNAVENRRLSC